MSNSNRNEGSSTLDLNPDGAFGPDPPFPSGPNAALQVPHSCRSCVVQHFGGENDRRAAKPGLQEAAIITSLGPELTLETDDVALKKDSKQHSLWLVNLHSATEAISYQAMVRFGKAWIAKRTTNVVT